MFRRLVNLNVDLFDMRVCVRAKVKGGWWTSARAYARDNFSICAQGGENSSSSSSRNEISKSM